MSLRRRREEVLNPIGDLAERVQALESALKLGGEQLPAQDVESAVAVLRRYRERFGLSGDFTVVALAGSTGAGKSSLFNALVGEDVSQTSVRRPTTSRTNAAVWGDAFPAELLDWLGVETRHLVKTAGELTGLVLLDLPDFDSRELANRAEADRVLALVDAYVWVTDPQKYADAIWHDDYLARVAGSQAASFTVINQSDRLRADDVPRVCADLERLLRAGGDPHPQVIPASAKTPQGRAGLVRELATLVESKNAAARRALADVTTTARALSSSVGAPSKQRLGVTAELSDALTKAAGIDVVVDAVESDYIRECSRETGSPFTRYVRGLRPDPLKRLRLDKAASADVAGRTGLPPASPVARAQLERQQNELIDAASTHMPQRWRDAMYEMRPSTVLLADHLDQAVARVPLKTVKPAWWKLIGLLQWLFAGLAIVGAAWLIFLAGAASVQIHLEAPTFGSWLPIPLTLLIAGLALSFLLAYLMRIVARAGGRHARRRAEQRVRASVEQVAQTDLIEPIVTVLERHDEVAGALALAGR